MQKIKKTPLTRGFLGNTDSAAAESTDRLIVSQIPPKYNTRAIGGMLDLALSKIEFHEALANFHASQAKLHRQVLHELQRLIPAPKPLQAFETTEGELSNE